MYVYINGLLVGLVDGNTISHVEADHLGRPELVLQSGLIKWRAANTTFGRTTVSSGITLDVGFLGQIYKGETGLWYNWHRYYDAGIGRYIRSDPVGLSGGTNIYSYVNGNPLSFIDAEGLSAEDIAYCFERAQRFNQDLQFPKKYKVLDLGVDENGKKIKGQYTHYGIFGLGELRIDKSYEAKNLSPAQMEDLYDTIIHEVLHKNLGPVANDEEHRWVYEDAARRTSI